MSYAYQMSSPKRYTERPPANCRAARWAWDRFGGEIVCLWLGEGYWSCERPDGSFDDMDATYVRRSYADD